MENNEIIRRGTMALRLLADDEAMWFFRELERDIMAASFDQASTDAAQRESVYFQLKGIHDVLGRMDTYAKAAEAVLTALNETNTTHDD